MSTLRFLGACGTVTGSKFLLESGSHRVLLDCGVFQGSSELKQKNWDPPPFDPASLDAVVLTHAHIDHTGYLPKLIRSGYAGEVTTSKATADLLRILLPDSARLQEEEADYRNRHQLTSYTPALPLYDEDDARSALDLLAPVSNDGLPHDIVDGFRASFSVAGHIMGASEVLVEISHAGPDN